MQHKCKNVCCFKNKTLNLHTKHQLMIEMTKEPPMLYNHWVLLCLPLYFLWFPIFVCFFVGVPSIIVWLFLFYIIICSILQAINIHHALNNNDKPLAIKMFLLQLIGIFFAVWPITCNIDYSIRYMVQHNIFSSFP